MKNFIIIIVLSLPLFCSEQSFGSLFATLVGEHVTRPHYVFTQPSDQNIYEDLAEDMDHLHTNKKPPFSFKESEVLNAARDHHNPQAIVHDFLQKLSTLDQPTMWKSTTPNTFPLCQETISHKILFKLNLKWGEVSCAGHVGRTFQDMFVDMMSPLIHHAKKALAQQEPLTSMEDLEVFFKTIL